jgi:site-specific DNA recombinase
MMDELGLADDPPAQTQKLMTAALERSNQWRLDSPAGTQRFVRQVVRRVVVYSDRIEVEVGKRELRAALAEEPLASSCQRVAESQHLDASGVIRLNIDARVQRCGGEVRLVLSPDSAAQMQSHPVSSLLKALARGRQWLEWIVAGETLGQRSIAKRLALDERYVSRVLECAFLAPDIVEAILDGRQPPDFTFEKLRRRLPVCWVEQRRQLGFPLQQSSR